MNFKKSVLEFRSDLRKLLHFYKKKALLELDMQDVSSSSTHPKLFAPPSEQVFISHTCAIAIQLFSPHTHTTHARFIVNNSQNLKHGHWLQEVNVPYQM